MQKLDAVIIICSTPKSRRIPQKCFRKINGKPVLTHIFDRIEKSGLDTILAIPNNLTVSEEAHYFAILGLRKVYLTKGSDKSPLLRIYEALIHYKLLSGKVNFPKYVIRITHDDIFIDSDTMVEMVKEALINDLDYVYCSNILGGAGVEVIKTENLINKAKSIDYPVEHISYFVRQGKMLNYKAKSSIAREYNLTMDYPEDVVVLEQILRCVGNNAPISLICAYLDNYGHILNYNKRPLLTLYTCCYNAEQYIEECMMSVLLAKKICHKRIEYILIDDCSTDGSLYNILNNALAFEKDIHIITNEENKGLSSCCNIALDMAKGKYIMRLDADDKLNSILINNYLEIMEQNNFSILYPNYNIINRNGERIGEGLGGELHHAGGALMNKWVINEIKFTEGLKHWDSLDLYNRLKKHTNLEVGYTNLPIFSYRHHDKSLSHNKENQGIRKKVLELLNGNILG